MLVTAATDTEAVVFAVGTVELDVFARSDYERVRGSLVGIKGNTLAGTDWTCASLLTITDNVTSSKGAKR